MTWTLGPANAANDETDVGWVDPKRLCDGALRETLLGHRTDGRDIVLSQLCHPVPLAAGMPSLRHAVVKVRPCVSKKQMGGVDASSHIAAMKNELPFRDWPVRDLPREAVRGHSVVALAPSAAADDPITVATDPARPEPTRVGIVGDIDTKPKPHVKRCDGTLGGSHRSTPSLAHAPGGRNPRGGFVVPIIPQNPHIYAESGVH